jgi:uncharacterized RmlC-like cupin family protein
MQRATVQVVGPGDRSSEGPQTPGMHRDEAFADEGSWVGLVRAGPGQVSGWHHHGEYETFFYCVSGRVRLEHGRGGLESAEARAGDFARIPKGVVHRESNPEERSRWPWCSAWDPAFRWSTWRAPMPEVGSQAGRR